MDKNLLLQLLKNVDADLKDFTFNGKETDIISFYDEINEKYEYDISQFLIIQKKSEILIENKPKNIDGSSIISFSTTYNLKVLGIDYEFLEFLFNDGLALADKNLINEGSKTEIIFNGRVIFKRNSYETSDILMSKIINSINYDKNIDELYAFIENNCYPNMGGYAAVENAFIIGSLYFEKYDYKHSYDYFNKMKNVDSISKLTISDFYKKAATLFYEKELYSEALKLIETGIGLNSKLSVKKMKSKIENKLK